MLLSCCVPACLSLQAGLGCPTACRPCTVSTRSSPPSGRHACTDCGKTALRRTGAARDAAGGAARRSSVLPCCADHDGRDPSYQFRATTNSEPRSTSYGFRAAQSKFHFPSYVCELTRCDPGHGGCPRKWALGPHSEGHFPPSGFAALFARRDETFAGAPRALAPLVLAAVRVPAGRLESGAAGPTPPGLS